LEGALPGKVVVAIGAGRSGSFEVVANGKLLYSKLATGKFPVDNDAIVADINAMLAAAPAASPAPEGEAKASS